MPVEIIVDSACDITLARAKELGLTFMPLTTRIDGAEYRDGVDISHMEFYRKLETCRELPTTSQITPYAYTRALEACRARGSEAVIITLSSALSGTYQSACAAAQAMGEGVYVVDSENVTIGERILVEYAVTLRDKGLPAWKIAVELELAKRRICLIALVDTLEYLVKGGRLSKTAGFAGALLNIKPVLGVENGKLTVLGKARGSRQSNNLLNEQVQKRGGIDFTMPLMLAYSGPDDALLRGYIENSRSLWEGHADKLAISTIGSTVGTHAGPGAIAVAFFAPEA